MSGYSTQNLSRAERGLVNLRADSAQDLAEVLCVPEHYMAAFCLLAEGHSQEKIDAWLEHARTASDLKRTLINIVGSIDRPPSKRRWLTTQWRR